MNRKNIKILRNKKVFCKIVNSNRKHVINVYKPNSKISFKLKYNKTINDEDIDLVNLEYILSCLYEADLSFTTNFGVYHK